MKGGALFFAALLLASCAEKPPQAKWDLRPVRFADLRGWQEDRPSEALPALSRSCAATRPQKTAGAAKACEALEKEPPANDGEARRFFETWFTPYAVRNQKDGLFTGYYEAELRGSWQRGGAYQTPLWQKPADLVTVDLGPFKPELKGQSLAGKVAEQKLVPYDDRAAVARGALAGRAQPLLWTDDPI
ncbi:MAG: murein transglycosylase, partial [Alphaproteobacteria bacterium]|nr:murein transglycosylase [Alphaproteobacteria bacterium]